MSDIHPRCNPFLTKDLVLFIPAAHRSSIYECQSLRTRSFLCFTNVPSFPDVEIPSALRSSKILRCSLTVHRSVKSLLSRTSYSRKTHLPSLLSEISPFHHAILFVESVSSVSMLRLSHGRPHEPLIRAAQCFHIVIPGSCSSALSQSNSRVFPPPHDTLLGPTDPLPSPSAHRSSTLKSVRASPSLPSACESTRPRQREIPRRSVRGMLRPPINMPIHRSL